MMNTRKLAGRTLFITGASRGIGKALALKAAEDGGKVVAARTVSRLSGAAVTAAKRAEDAGSCMVDSLPIDVKQYDLMHDVNTIGTLLVSETCLPRMKQSSNPELNMKQVLFKDHLRYTMPKCGMSSGIVGELKNDATAAATAQPRTSDKSLCPLVNLKMLGAVFNSHSQVKGSSQKRLMSTQAGDGVEGIFTSIKGKLNADIVNATQAVFQFNLTGGSNEETYHIDLRNGEGTAGKGKPADAPDATLTMNTENFHKLFAGKLKPTAAFMTGKLKISGNMQKAMKLEKLLTSLKGQK